MAVWDQSHGNEHPEGSVAKKSPQGINKYSMFTTGCHCCSMPKIWHHVSTGRGQEAKPQMLKQFFFFHVSSPILAVFFTSALQQYCLHHCGNAPSMRRDVEGIGVDHVSAWKLEKFIVMVCGMAGEQIPRKRHPASPTKASPWKHIRCGKKARPDELHSGSWWGKWRALRA